MDKWTDEWAKAAQGMAHHDCWFLLLFSMTIFQLHGIYTIHKYVPSSMSDIESERQQQQQQQPPHKKNSYKKYTARIEIIPRHIIIISMHIKYKKALYNWNDSWRLLHQLALVFSLSIPWTFLYKLIWRVYCVHLNSIDEKCVRTVYSKCDTTSLTAHIKQENGWTYSRPHK